MYTVQKVQCQSRRYRGQASLLQRQGSPAGAKFARDSGYKVSVSRLTSAPGSCAEAVWRWL